MKLKFLLFLICFMLGYTNCKANSLYDIMEEKYQTDADNARMHHLDYYAQLLEEYKLKNGVYPFQNKYTDKEPIYISIMTDEQINYYFKGKNPPPAVLTDSDFFRELEKGLGRLIDEKYDPQKIPTGCPPMYLYSLQGNQMTFIVHLYHANKFTKPLNNKCHEFVLSNGEDGYSYNSLKDDADYKKLLIKKLHPRFEHLDEQYKDDSKK